MSMWRLLLLAAAVSMVRAALIFRVMASQTPDASESTALCESDLENCTAVLVNATIVQDDDGQNVFSFVNLPPFSRAVSSRVDVVPRPPPLAVQELTATAWVQITDPLTFRFPANFVTNRRPQQLLFSFGFSNNPESPFGPIPDLRMGTGQKVNGNAVDFAVTNSRSKRKVVFPQRWHHFAAVMNGTHAVLFLDAVEVAAAVRQTSAVVLVDTFTIGSSRDPQSFASITGRMDDIRFYDEALSAAQLKAVFHGLAPNDRTNATLPAVFDLPLAFTEDLDRGSSLVSKTRVVAPSSVALTDEMHVARAFVDGNETNVEPLTLPAILNVTDAWLLVRVASAPQKAAAIEGFGPQFSLGIFRIPDVNLGMINNTQRDAFLMCASIGRFFSRPATRSDWRWVPFDAFECSPAPAAGEVRFALRFTSRANTTVNVRLYEWIANPYADVDSVAARARPILPRRSVKGEASTSQPSAATATTRTGTTGTSSTRSTARATNSTAAPVAGDPAAPSGGNVGAIIGGVVGGIAAVALIVGGVLFWRKRSASSSAAPAAPASNYGKIDLSTVRTSEYGTAPISDYNSTLTNLT